MSFKKKISILGATGSIGQSTADVICGNADAFDVISVTANQNAPELAKIAKRLNAKNAIIADESKQEELCTLLRDTDINVYSGAKAINEASIDGCDIIMAAMMGFSGLLPIVNALEKGIDVAIANKEPLVAAGAQIMALSQKTSAKILPVDSEHNAIFQVFDTKNKAAIEKIILTASGGPFRTWKSTEIYNATVEQAIKHPTWSMGRKISVDSASMMNKALEIIEAYYLFDLPSEKIEVLIHPQSIIHSMVAYNDGSVLSQMGASDMRTPIANALAWPHRIDSHGNKLDLHALSSLSFEKPDFDKFPTLKHAYKCLERGQDACIIFNAVNEIAVEKFLEGKMKFGKIFEIIDHAMNEIYAEHKGNALKDIAQIVELDHIVRNQTVQFIEHRL